MTRYIRGFMPTGPARPTGIQRKRPNRYWTWLWSVEKLFRALPNGRWTTYDPWRGAASIVCARTDMQSTTGNGCLGFLMRLWIQGCCQTTKEIRFAKFLTFWPRQTMRCGPTRSFGVCTRLRRGDWLTSMDGPPVYGEDLALAAMERSWPHLPRTANGELLAGEGMISTESRMRYVAVHTAAYDRG